MGPLATGIEINRPGPILKVASRHLPGVTEKKTWKSINLDVQPLVLKPGPSEGDASEDTSAW